MRLTALLVVPGLLWPVPVLSQEWGFFSADDPTTHAMLRALRALPMSRGGRAFGTGWRLCLPQSNVTARQLVDVVMAYLRAHPEARAYSAASVGHVAFSQAFPCVSKRPPPK